MCAAALLCVAAVTQAQAESQPPYVPTSDAQVLERLPTQSDPRAMRFAQLRQRQLQQPRDISAAATLAQAYLDYGRGTGDARYLGRAEGVLAPWLRVARPDRRIVLLQATLLQSRHQFAEARVLLQRILRDDPANSQAWLTLSSIALVQGDMDTARAACAHLLGEADGLVTAGCIGAWSTANGHAAATVQMLTGLLPQSRTLAADVRSWELGLLADAAKTLGQDERADAAFRQALALSPGDNFLIADYADYLLDHARAADALRLTTGFEQSDTSFLRKTLAEQALHAKDAQTDIARMASRFKDLEQRGDSRLYGREEARFVLELQHDPARALQLAKDDWTIQRAPEDIRVYLQAALAAGRPEAAQPALDFARRTHVEDPVVRALAAKLEARSVATAVAAVGNPSGATP